MKLFIYDSKHSNILGELDLGSISAETEEVVDKIINFLDETEFTTRYKEMTVANGVGKKFDEDSGEYYLSFF